MTKQLPAAHAVKGQAMMTQQFDARHEAMLEQWVAYVATKRRVEMHYEIRIGTNPQGHRT